MQWTEVHHPRGIFLGEPEIHHKIKQCPRCKTVYRFEGIGNLVPTHGNYSFDIIVEVGLARYRRHKQNQEIQKELENRFGLKKVSSSTISNLANQFLDYFAAVHYASSEVIKNSIYGHEGYALHADGTCEAGTDIIFVVRDGLTKLALVSEKIPTENIDDITDILKKCVKLFGVPLSSMRDLSPNIAAAKQNVEALKDVVDLICHYHFLKTVGERLFESIHAKLTTRLRSLKIRPALTSLRGDMVQATKQNKLISEEEIKRFIDDPQSMLLLDPLQLRRCLSYMLLRWLDDYGADLKGEFFPFDLPSLAFYRRCAKLYSILKKLLDKYSLKPHQLQTIQTITSKLEVMKNDQEVVETSQRLEIAERLFEQLRITLRFKNPKTKGVLRQHQVLSSVKVAAEMKDRLTVFRKRLHIIMEVNDDPNEVNDARIILGYLDKYWNNLYGHVTYTKSSGKLVLLPRTNNISEHGFDDIKQGERRRLGIKKLRRCLQAMRPEQLLVANLDNQQYVDAVYGGSLGNMPTYFSRFWQQGKEIRKARKQQASNHPIPISKKKLRDQEWLPKMEKAIETLINITVGNLCPRKQPCT